MLHFLIAVFLYQQPSVPVHGLEAASEIVVEYEDSVSDRKRRSFERAVGLPVLHGYKTLAGEDRETGHTFRYQVPSGQEVSWVNALHLIPFIKKAESGTSPIVMSGVDETSVFSHRAYGYVFGAGASAYGLLVARGLTAQMLEDHFTSMYLGKNGQLRVLGRGKNFLHFQVDHLRGEVLRDNNFWEEIEVYAVFFPVGPGRVEMHIFLDDKYAAGLGKSPPGESGFSPIGPEFYGQENDYLSSIMVSVEDLARRRGLQPDDKKGATTK